MAGVKRFRSSPALDSEDHPLPESLKRCMALIGDNFFTAHMRNLEIMNTSERSLYGLMTHYESRNFCWIQPARFKSKKTSKDFDHYTRISNRLARKGKLGSLFPTSPGDLCLAQYDLDQNWYRAVVVGHTAGDRTIVLFIDYGNFQHCSNVQIHAPYYGPEEDFLSVPLQAVCCRLYNIVPRLPSYREEIDIKLEKFFLDHSDQFLELKVVNVRPDFVADVDVFVSTKDEGPDRLYRKHIGQELVDSGIATFADPKAAHAIK